MSPSCSNALCLIVLVLFTFLSAGSTLPLPGDQQKDANMSNETENDGSDDKHAEGMQRNNAVVLDRIQQDDLNHAFDQSDLNNQKNQLVEENRPKDNAAPPMNDQNAVQNKDTRIDQVIEGSAGLKSEDSKQQGVQKELGEEDKSKDNAALPANDPNAVKNKDTKIDEVIESDIGLNSEDSKQQGVQKQLSEEDKSKDNAAPLFNDQNAVQKKDPKIGQAIESGTGLKSEDSKQPIVQKQLGEEDKPKDNAAPLLNDQNAVQKKDPNIGQAIESGTGLKSKDSKQPGVQKQLGEEDKPKENAAPSGLSAGKNNDVKIDQVQEEASDVDKKQKQSADETKQGNDALLPEDDSKLAKMEQESKEKDAKIGFLNDQAKEEGDNHDREPEKPDVVQPGHDSANHAVPNVIWKVPTLKQNWFSMEIYVVLLFCVLLIILCVWRQFWHCVFRIIGWNGSPTTHSATDHMSVPYKLLATK